MFAIERETRPIVREYMPRGEDWAVPPRIPANLSIPAIYQPIVMTMLERSPTFRRQCRRIAHTPSLMITVQAAGASALGRVRARTRIGRSSGFVIAAIEVLHLEDPVELIAHEIEHIIEQLDGIDLAARAVIATSGVHISDADRHSFETTRAKRIGLTVASEVRGDGR